MKDDSADNVTLQLTATAYHEAGHAVMALALGRAVEKVTVATRNTTTGGVRLGICKMQKGRSGAAKHETDDDVLILFAGMVAEARHTGQYCRLGASEDLRAIRRLLLHRARDERQLERIQERLLAKTEHVLAEASHALAVEWIARELIEKRSVSGRAVRHFFDLALKQTS